MKLLRNRQPQRVIDSGDVDLLFYLFVLIRDGIPAYRALRDRRAGGEAAQEIAPEALGWARGVCYGYVAALTLIEHPDEPLQERVPPELYPVQALGLLAQLACAFCGLTEQHVVEDALMSSEELDGLVEHYAAGSWIEAMREMIGRVTRGTEHSGADLPAVAVDVTPAAVPEGGATPLRALLLARELPTGPDLPLLPDGPHDESFPVYMRFLAMILLLAHHGERYTELNERWEQETGPDLEAQAIEAANDIALVLLWFGRRLQLLLAARRSPQLDPTEAWGLLSELCFGFLLTSSPHQAQREMRLDPGRYLEARLANPRITQFVAALGLEATLITDVRSELRQMRNEGADQGELLAHALARVTGDADGLEREDD
jgi:hypothetical protein